MIRCYYTQETLDRVAKAGRYRAIGCGGLICVFLVLALVGTTVQNPQFWFRFTNVMKSLFAVGFLGILSYFFHRLIFNIEETTLEHGGDEITLNDDEVRLVKEDGTQITLPRKGLKIRGSYFAAGIVVYTIRNRQFAQNHEIVLTSHAENAKKLLETIQPGAWDEGE